MLRAANASLEDERHRFDDELRTWQQRHRESQAIVRKLRQIVHENSTLRAETPIDGEVEKEFSQLRHAVSQVTRKYFARREAYISSDYAALPRDAKDSWPQRTIADSHGTSSSTLEVISLDWVIAITPKCKKSRIIIGMRTVCIVHTCI